MTFRMWLRRSHHADDGEDMWKLMRRAQARSRTCRPDHLPIFRTGAVYLAPTMRAGGLLE